MSKKPKEFIKTVKFLANKLNGTQYAIRGTASLVLQEFDMNVDDIDILCDKKTALACNSIFKDFLVEKVQYKASQEFKSYYGKFEINDIQVEIMGEWQIKAKGKWSKAFKASKEETRVIDLENTKVSVTTIETELKMFALMGRWNALHKIKLLSNMKGQRNLIST